MQDKSFDEAYRDDITTKIFIEMMGPYINDDPAEMAQKARRATDALLAELAKQRAEPDA